MKLQTLRHRTFCLLTRLVAAVGLFWQDSAAAQSVSLGVQANSGRLTISWPAGLSLVQPQVATNLTTDAWRDFGTATESTNLVDTIGSGPAFYRLRFLAPSIQTQPLGRSVAAGSNVTLNVTAVGTAPLAYQWRKNGANLSGQTEALLGLNNVSIGDSGDYSVMVTNQVGAVSSMVAVLTVTNVLPSLPPRGIYMGSFAGETNGGFAAMVGTNGVAMILAHNVSLGEGMLTTNVSLTGDGSFSIAGEKQGKVTGRFGRDAADGTITGTNGLTGAFSAAVKPATGIHQGNAGFYVGTFGGLLTGNVFFILAADGAAFTYLTSPALGGGGASGVIDAKNAMSATAAYTLPGTTVPALIQITGSLNPTTHSFAGTYGLGGITLGTFSLARSVAP